MTHDPDPRLAELLHAGLLRDAPLERDPLFRVAVLARLERAKYRRRLVAILAGAAALALVSVLGLSVGGAAREGTSVLIIGAALAAAYFVVTPALTQLLARFR